jgi:raffinose/stachyose/melibiose transport system substrate-binding protein
VTRKRGLIAVLVAVAAVGLGACGSSGSSSSSGTTSLKASKSGSHTMQLWLGGDLTQATPGSPFLAWVHQQIGRFEAQNPGWKITTQLLPFDNGANAAQLEAAFAAHNTPDLMNLYSGQFTNAYTKVLLPLTKYVSQTPGLYASIPESVWNVECTNYQCNGGQGTILGIPWNSGAYYLFYNKALLAKAGIKSPPKTYTEMFAACAKLRAAGVLPVSMGATDGYDTSNVFTSNLVSTLGQGDMASILSGKVPYDDPKLVAALAPVLQLTSPSTKCTDPNALGEDQLHGINAFQAGKAAMTPYFGLQLAAFQKALGSKLGVAPLPLSGSGPLLHVNNGYAGNPFDGWVIPKNSPNADMAWKFIKLASDASANKTSQSMMGLSPAVTSVTEKLTDPLQKTAAQLAANPAINELDQVMPGTYAVYMYKQLALGQEGKQSAKQSLSNLQQYAVSQRAQGQ